MLYILLPRTLISFWFKTRSTDYCLACKDNFLQNVKPITDKTDRSTILSVEPV